MTNTLATQHYRTREWTELDPEDVPRFMESKSFTDALPQNTLTTTSSRMRHLEQSVGRFRSDRLRGKRANMAFLADLELGTLNLPVRTDATIYSIPGWENLESGTVVMVYPHADPVTGRDTVRVFTSPYREH